MASPVREIVQNSASVCTYETSSVVVSKTNDWVDASDASPDAMAEDDANSTMVAQCTCLQKGCSIRIAPMERRCGGWADEHFHDKLALPAGSMKMRGVVVMLEAKARECVAVALSPEPYFVMGKTYVVHFGAAGNLNTVIRRRLPNGTEAVDATFPSRVCTPSKWSSYWIVLQGGKLSAGVGCKVGQQCIGTLDDSMYDQLRPGMDAVHYVGLGNSALGQAARDLKVRNVRVVAMPSQLFGDHGIPMQEMQHQIDMAAPGQDTHHDAALLAQYEEECAKAKARAIKFGVPYKEPPKPDAFLRYSEARRLRDNPEAGFITGIDMLSKEEQDKAQARKIRFQQDQQKRKRDAGEMDDDDMLNDDEEDDAAQLEAAKSKDPLPVDQAWDNQARVASQRIDPPAHLFLKEIPQPPSPQFLDQTPAQPVKEKVHLFALDWAAFKQIRSPDIMAHFADYGPSYVEWLNELSCNVLFEDEYSAARALANMTMEIPSPPPEPQPTPAITTDETADQTTIEDVIKEKKLERQQHAENNDNQDDQMATEQEEEKQKEEKRIDYGAMGWRFGKFTLRKVANDQFGRRGTRSRFLARTATTHDILEQRPTEKPRPPKGFTTRRVLGPGTEERAERRERRNRQRGGGRRGNNNNKQNNRRRGGGGGKRRRRGERYDSGGNNYEEMDEEGEYFDDDDNDEYNEMDDSNKNIDTRINQGLKSSRAGFSVEEMEKERAEKMQQQIGDGAGEDTGGGF